jgi:hypothetical protein
MNYDKAKLVYDTIKENYLEKDNYLEGDLFRQMAYYKLL